MIVFKYEAILQQVSKKRRDTCSPVPALLVQAPCQEGVEQTQTDKGALGPCSSCRISPRIQIHLWLQRSHHNDEHKPVLKHSTKSAFSIIRKGPLLPECTNSGVPFVGENNAHLSIMTNQEQGCHEQQHHTVVLGEQLPKPS